MFQRSLTVTDSKVIQAVHYNFEEQKLRVEFLSGAVWDYARIPLHVFGQLACAHSIGAAFNELVRDRFHAEKVKTVEMVTKILEPRPRAHFAHDVDQR